jgi:hypothetical protein
MFGNLQRPVTSNPATQFVEALAQDEISINYDLALPVKSPLVFVNGFTIVSAENLAWELWLFATSIGLTDLPSTDALVGMWAFPVIAAQQVGYTVTPAGTGVPNTLYRYHITGNMIPYYDEEWMNSNSTGYPALHLRLVNRAGVAKTAAAPGALAITAFISQGGIQA